MKKPLSIILISILNMVVGCFALLLAFMYAMTKSMHPIFVFVFSIFGVVYIALSIGLFRLKNWARILSIIFFSLAIVENIFSHLFIAKGPINAIEIAGTLFRLIISALVVFFLLKKSVRSSFMPK